MTDHGPLYDVFTRQSGSPHNGPEFDEAFPQVTGQPDPLLDDSTKRPRVSKHGELWDEFGWRDMPAKHGQNFDSNFGQPVAHDGADGHGTWHDVFRGAQVRYLVDGAHYEGTVLNTGDDHAIVEPRGGGRHEIGLGQVLQYRQPMPARDGIKTAQPGTTDTSVVGGPQGERPSGESATAMGGGQRTTIDPGMESVVANKTAGEDLDVAKDVDATETATQRQDDGGAGGSNAWCQTCSHYCRKTEGGRCPTCGKATVMKTAESDEDILKSLADMVAAEEAA